MGRVELTLKEYNDLVEETSTILKQNLELKKELIEANEKNCQLLAKCMEVSPWIYEQNFTKKIEITNDNLDDYVVQYIYDEYTREEVLKGVKYLYGKRFNKR